MHIYFNVIGSLISLFLSNRYLNFENRIEDKFFAIGNVGIYNGYNKTDYHEIDEAISKFSNLDHVIMFIGGSDNDLYLKFPEIFIMVGKTSIYIKGRKIDIDVSKLKIEIENGGLIIFESNKILYFERPSEKADFTVIRNYDQDLFYIDRIEGKNIESLINVKNNNILYSIIVDSISMKKIVFSGKEKIKKI